jgi:hypothetical protein
MSGDEIAGPVVETLDAVYAIFEAKAEAGLEDHAEDPELEEAVGTFLATFEEHIPEPWLEEAPLAQLLYLEVWFGSRAEARRAGTASVVRRWLGKRIADSAAAN